MAASSPFWPDVRWGVGFSAPLPERKKLNTKRESIINMFGSFLPSLLVGWRHQSLLGRGSRHCYGIICLRVTPPSDTLKPKSSFSAKLVRRLLNSNRFHTNSRSLLSTPQEFPTKIDFLRPPQHPDLYLFSRQMLLRMEPAYLLGIKEKDGRL